MRYTKAVNPEDVWDNKRRWLARARGIVATGLSEAGVTGLLVAKFSTHWPVIVGAGVFLLIITIAALWIWRKSIIREANANVALHNCFHRLRKAAALVEQQRRFGNQASYRSELDRFNERAVAQTAEYFKQLTEDKNVNCAIRLVQRDPNTGEELLYTRARSSGMEQSRDDVSVPISMTEGIGLFIRAKKEMGVCYVDDIQHEIDHGNWVETPNDDKADVRKLMIAPINGFVIDDGEEMQKEILGIIYLTSIDLEFSERHACQLMAIADTLGALYPFLTDPFARAKGGVAGVEDDVRQDSEESGSDSIA